MQLGHLHEAVSVRHRKATFEPRREELIELLRVRLQTGLEEVLLDEGSLRQLGSFLPTHDYQVAAFRAKPIQTSAATAFQSIFNGDYDYNNNSSKGWDDLYVHRVPDAPHRCAVHLVLAPLHEVHDAAAVKRYEAQIEQGCRPVVLALCAGLPYNVGGTHSGMDVSVLTEYSYHDREIATMRAWLASAQQRLEADGAESTAGVVQNYQSALAEYEHEYRNNFTGAQWVEQQAEHTAKRAAAIASSNGLCTNGLCPKVQRVGLCTILDGHHKIKAAANLGAAVTVLCYGLQGVAMTPRDVPGEMNGDADNLYLDSEAIFDILAKTEC